MTDNQTQQAVARDADLPEFLDPGQAMNINISPTSSESSTATSILSKARQLSNATDSTSPDLNIQSARESIDANQYGTNSNNTNNSSTMFQLERRPTGSWFDTVLSSPGNASGTKAKTTLEGIARDAAHSLLELHKSETARPAKRPYEPDDEAEPIVIQSPTPSTIDRQAGFSSPSREKTVQNGSVQAPLSSHRYEVEPYLSVHDTASRNSEGTIFSQTYCAGRGWTAINVVPKHVHRPEDDLSIKANSIIPAPNTPYTLVDTRDRAMSSPSVLSSPSSISTLRPHRRPRRAATTPTSNNGTEPSTETPATQPSSFASICKLSPDSSIPASATSPTRRAKWKGKSFQTLIFEALRAAADTQYALTTKQIAAYIEEYRLTTDMTEPALAQTIRAAVMNGARHIMKDGTMSAGFWEHRPDKGKRTGPYMLLPEWMAGGAVGAVGEGGIAGDGANADEDVGDGGDAPGALGAKDAQSAEGAESGTEDENAKEVPNAVDAMDVEDTLMDDAENNGPAKAW